MAEEGNIDPGVIGTDSFPPVYNPLRRFTTWIMGEIYTGAAGLNKYVPNVGDLVYEVIGNTVRHYRVEYVDESTKISTLKALIETDDSGELTDEDLLLGIGPGTDADTYLIYVDKSVTPYYCAIDARLQIKGSMGQSGRVYRGADISDNTQLLSLLYDASNNFLGNDIPLQLVDREENIAVKVLPPFHTLADLADGERLTAVFHSDTGGQLSKRQLNVVNTGFIWSSNANLKYVTGISLRSPFLSSVDPDQIDFPINTTLFSMNLIGVVHYSDGTELEMPVDGNKFEMIGFDNYLATQPGQQFDVMLKYNLSPSEIHFGSNVVGSDRFFAREYEVRTMAQDGAYTVKLFAYPNWIDAVAGYRMEYFLMNLERSVNVRVTPYVQLQEGTPAFEPLTMGVKQNLSVQLDLKNAIPAYKNYLHAQTLAVTLLTGGGELGTNWRVEYDPGQNPQFGVNNKFEFIFINANLKQTKIDMGLNDQAVWLERLYSDAKPLINLVTEDVPPAPTHFAIITNTSRTEHLLSEWKDVFDLGQEIYHGHTLYIEFFKRTVNNDLKLAVAGVPLRQVVAFTV